MAKVGTASIFLVAMSLVSFAHADVDAMDDLVNALEDETPIVADLFANDDGFGDLFVLDGFTLPAEGTLTVDASGSMNLDVPPNFNGDITFQYTVVSQSVACVADDTIPECSDTATVTVSVAAVGNDAPDAVDDAFTVAEDTLETTFDVLENDDLGDTPTIILALGDTGEHSFINGNGDTITQSNATIRVEAGEVVYAPAANFWGTDTFTYTIQDAQGDIDSATVTVTVEGQNDPPTGTVLRIFSIFEGGILAVGETNGLLLGVFDIDGQVLDENGDPVGSLLSIQITSFPAPSEGNLVVNTANGAFSFTPASGFTGTTGFTYRLSDSEDFSPNYEIEIGVTSSPPPPEPPNPGEVAIDWNLSNAPLEQTATVAPNVLVTMDDSGSMDWNVSIDGVDDQGRMELSNADISNFGIFVSHYTYLYDLSTNAYEPDSVCCGGRLASQESLPAGSQHGVWRARSAEFNEIYYNPEITYMPWIGRDTADNDFVNAVAASVRLDPIHPGVTVNITEDVDYTSLAVPNWDTGGGATDIDVTDYYIPRYYTTTAQAPLQWDSPHTLVEIRPGNAPFVHLTARDDCRDGNPLHCSYEQEMQNFANWFQYYRSRELVAKASIGRVVADVQDVRVGYETINNRVSESVSDMNEYYWEGEKDELLDVIYGVDSFGNTPLRSALDRSGRILSCTEVGRDCPALPAPEGICQQNFSVLFSDGYWNGAETLTGNHDGDDDTTFDGGKYADTFTSSLADVAMHYYENDMFSAVPDGVPVGARDIAGAPTGTFSGGGAMHQHMKTFTIAFGVEGDIDPLAAQAENPATPIAWPDPFVGGNAKIDDMVHAAVNGRGSYLFAGNPEELQSAFESAFLEFTQAASSTSAAAFSSTSLREETLLYRGFYDLRTKTGELTATAVDAQGVLATTPTWSAAELLSATHPEGLSSDERVIVTFDRDTMSGIPFRHAQLNADQQLTLDADEVDFIRGSDTNEQPGGTMRDRPDIFGNLGDIVNSSPVFVGSPRALHRDQAPYPISAGNLYSTFSANNQNRQPIVYVGANDGMMHGFDATTGVEQMAYIPNMLIDSSEIASNKLDAFVSPFYLHNYYVDMTPRLRDIYSTSRVNTSKHWMTAMVGGLGGGGKGFFALDVTDPTIYGSESSADDAVLWEFGVDDDTYPVDQAGNPLGGSVGAIVDSDGLPVKDLGFSLSLPSIVMSNVGDGTAADDRKWMAIFGNGPNSTAGIAKLFVLSMDGALDGSWDSGDFTKLDTGFGVPLPGEPLAGFPNYLGTPTLVDVDSNGTADLAYAGDRLGNLFRFDLSDADPDQWTVTRLFTAHFDDGATTHIQPILARPLVVKHPDLPGYVITFGTGSFVTETDGGDTDIQSIYGIWDPLLEAPATAAADTKATRLVQQTLTNVVDDSVTPSQTRRALSANAVEYSAAGADGTYGWYIDLNPERASNTLSGGANPDMSGDAPPLPQFPGEKAIRRFIFRDGAVITTTVLPATNATSCVGVRPGAIMVFSAMTGGDFGAPIIDFNTDGVIDEGDTVAFNGEENSAGLLFNFSDLAGSLVDLSILGSEGENDFLVVSGGSDTIFYQIGNLSDNKTGRLSWTEVEVLE